MTNPNGSAYYETEHYKRSDGTFGIADKGFTKREVVLKDFMCAIISNPECRDELRVNYVGFDSSILTTIAIQLTEAYFNELNKTTNE